MQSGGIWEGRGDRRPPVASPGPPLKPQPLRTAKDALILKTLVEPSGVKAFTHNLMSPMDHATSVQSQRTLNSRERGKKTELKRKSLDVSENDPQSDLGR